MATANSDELNIVNEVLVLLLLRVCVYDCIIIIIIITLLLTLGNFTPEGIKKNNNNMHVSVLPYFRSKHG